MSSNTKCQMQKSSDMTLSNYNIYVIDECTKVTLDFLFQKAQILGFPTHSSFVLDMRMAKTAEAVTTFLTDLSKKLQALKESEMKLFLEYKKEEARFVFLF